MEQHYLKKKIKTVSESNESRQINTSKEGIYYANAQYQLARGKPTSTWLSNIKSDFRNPNLTWDEAINTAIDIKTWENYSK